MPTATLSLTVLLLPSLLASPCPQRPGWFNCPGSASCLSPAQVCDGLTDCEDGSDEAECGGWRCEEGVRCEEGGVCIRVPGQVVCRGEGREVCRDGSDQAYCHLSQYSGCLLSSPHGLSLSHCDRCVCQLTAGNYSSGQLQARVCLGRDSPRLCDGTVDCVGGEDERQELCPPTTRGQELTKTLGIQRTTIIFVAISISCITIICLMMLIVWRLCLRNRSQSRDGESKKSLTVQEGTRLSSNVYVMEGRLERPKRSLTTTKIIKELGTGHFSKVFMSEDRYEGYVALKTSHPPNSEMAQRSIEKEITVLKEVGRHGNIIQMLDSNLEERLVVLEYCLYGNCKDYIARNKNLFVNQIDPDTQEMKIDEKEDFLFSSSDLLDTRTLIRWSLDMSRGLSYLAKINIIHRDLALRNILLSGKRTVKISDFGLAVSSTGQYWSKTDRPLPYKHSALESLTRSVFSTKTDVWAFGVTLWEMFSLASEPHAEISSLGELVVKLEAGEVMPGPVCPLAPLQLQSVMRSCWAELPADRPTARDITNLVSPLLYTQVPVPSHHSTPLVTSRSFYWTNYKVLQGQPQPVASSAQGRGSGSEDSDIEM